MIKEIILYNQRLNSTQFCLKLAFKMSKKSSSSPCVFLIVFLGVIRISHQFYLPGLAPVNYCKGIDTSKSCKVRIYTQKFDGQK